MSKILAVEWRASTVGIVAVEQPGGKWRAYIRATTGCHASEEDDAAFVAAHGSYLIEKEARAFFPGLDDRPYDVK